MKVAVFGSTGKTGVNVVKQALEEGYEVNAFVRDPQKMTLKHPKLKVFKGDILDPASIDKALKEVAAVILALGSKGDSTPNLLSKGTSNIISSMKANNVKRIVVMSSYAYSGSPEGMARLKKQAIDEEKLKVVQPRIEDKIKQEREVRESGLDYTIIRPLALTEGIRIGKYRAGEKLEVKMESNISREDVADFMLKSLKDNRWVGKTVDLSY